MNSDISTEDMLKMIEKINKRREAGRLRAKKWYDSHADEFKQKRLEKKLAKQELKKVEEKKPEPLKRGRKVKPVDINDVFLMMIKKTEETTL